MLSIQTVLIYAADKLQLVNSLVNGFVNLVSSLDAPKLSFYIITTITLHKTQKGSNEP